MHIEVHPQLGEAELAALEAVLRADAFEDEHPTRASAWRRTAAREAVGDEADEDVSENELPRRR